MSWLIETILKSGQNKICAEARVRPKNKDLRRLESIEVLPSTDQILLALFVELLTFVLHC